MRPGIPIPSSTAALLFIDEPSIGLSTAMVQQVMEHIAAIKTLGATVVLIEHNPARSSPLRTACLF